MRIGETLMSKKRNLELTGFNGITISTGERVQPNVSGIGEKNTLKGSTVIRSPKRVTPIYQGYANERTYLGAVACLNLIYQRAIPSFPTSDRSSPSTTVVVYADSRGSVGNTIPDSPIIFHYKEWRIIVVVAKDYKDSAFLQSLLVRRDYVSAIQHLETELREKYISANLIPSEIIVSTTNTIEQFFTEEITFQGSSGKIIIPSNSVTAFSFFDGTQDALSFDSSATILTSNYNLIVNGYLTVSGESTLASLTVSDIGANQLVFSENASGSLTGSGDLTFDGTTLALTGSATVSSDLTVNGATTLNDDLTITGNIDQTGSLNITGSITLNGQPLTVGTGAVDPNNAVFQDSLIILSDTADGLTFNTTDDVGFMWEKATGSFTGLAWDYSENHFALFSTATEPSTGELTITQYADFKANDLSAVNADLTGNLTGVGATFSADISAVNGTFSGSGSFNDLSVGGGFGDTGLTISDNGNVQTDGALSVGSTLDVNGVTNFNDTTSSTNATSGAVVIDGGLGVAENLNIGGDFTATNGTFSSDVSANNISATNSVLVGGGFGDVVDGGLTLSSNGDVQTDGALTVDGTSTFGDNVTVNADLSANNLSTSGATTTDTLSVGGGFGDTGLTVSTDGNLQTDGKVTSNELETVGDVTIGGDLTLSGTFTPNSLSISSLNPTHITYGGGAGELLGSVNFTWNNVTSTVSTVNANFTGDIAVTGESVLASATVSDLTQTRITLAGLNGSLEDSADLVFTGTALEIGGGQGNTGLSIDTSGNLSTDGGLSGDSITTVGNATIGGDLAVTGDFNPSSLTLSGLTATHILFGGATSDLADSANLTFNSATNTFASVNASFTTTLNVGGESTLASATVSDLTQSRIVLAGLNGSLEDNATLTYDGTTFSVGSDFTIDQATGDTSVGGTLGVTGDATFDGDGSFNTLSVGGGFGDVTDGGFSIGSDGAIQTDGSLTVDGTANFNDTTSSTNSTTGAVIIDGGLGVGENVNISGNLSATDINATNVNATDGDFSGTLTVNDLTINGTFSPTDITVSTLTPTHIVYGSGTNGLVGSGNLTWTDGTSTLSTVNVSMTGNVTVDGNTTLGSDTTDTITANAEFNSSLVASDTTSNLGSSAKSWGSTFTNNLQINFGVNEQFSTITNASGATTHNCSNGHIFYHDTPSGDFDVVLTNLTLSQNYATTITLLVEQGATGRKPNTTVTIGGGSTNILWQGGAPPTPTSSAGSVDVFCLSILRVGASNYIILGQMIEDFS